MADYFGVYQTKRFETSPPELVSGAIASGKAEMPFDYYTANGVLAAKVIALARPKKGQRWRPQSMLVWEALGTNVTLLVGTATDTDKFSGSAIAAAAIGFAMLNFEDGLDYEFDGETDVIVTTGGATTASSDKKITLAPVLACV